MNLIDCDTSHAQAILAIFNEVIANSTALYEYQPRSMVVMAAWFETKRQGAYPVLGALDQDGTLMGFASYGQFRVFPGYKFTVEHSVYVAAAFRGSGLGRRLLEAIIQRARSQDYHTMIGVIDSANAASIALHQRLGFTRAGELRQAGFKFNRWLDVSFLQLLLDTPDSPSNPQERSTSML